MTLPMKKVIISSAVVIFAAAVSVAVWYFYANKKVEQIVPSDRIEVQLGGGVVVEKESETLEVEKNTVETAAENMKIDMLWVDDTGKKTSFETVAENMKKTYPMKPCQLQFRRGEEILYSDYMYIASYATIKHGKDRCKWQKTYSFGDDWKKLLCDVDNNGKPAYLILCSTSVGFTGRGYCSTEIIKIAYGSFSKFAVFVPKVIQITGSQNTSGCPKSAVVNQKATDSISTIMMKYCMAEPVEMSI